MGNYCEKLYRLIPWIVCKKQEICDFFYQKFCLNQNRIKKSFFILYFILQAICSSQNVSGFDCNIAWFWQYSAFVILVFLFQNHQATGFKLLFVQFDCLVVPFVNSAWIFLLMQFVLFLTIFKLTRAFSFDKNVQKAILNGMKTSQSFSIRFQRRSQWRYNW